MSRFTAQIAISPEGYRWSQYEHYRPGLDDTFIFLDWAKQHSIREKYSETGEIAVDRFYDPFVEEPALYRIFAALEPTPEAILDFAEKYGDFTTVAELLEGEEHHLAEYKYEISAMRRFVEAADSVIARTGDRRTRPPKALLTYMNDILGTAPLRMSAVQERDGISLRLVVDGLLDVMKLQLAEAVADRKCYRECEHCNKPFEVTPQINRADRLFCSDNCRVKAYQRRKKQVLAMRKQGDPLRQIVKATGSDLDSVKRWIAKSDALEAANDPKKTGKR